LLYVKDTKKVTKRLDSWAAESTFANALELMQQIQQNATRK
jgi:hypothetical protein